MPGPILRASRDGALAPRSILGIRHGSSRPRRSMTTSKTTKAAALRYDRDESPAPRVVARGDGLIAERILAIAREHNIPIHQDPALVNVLSQLDLDQQIPPELYLAIAEVLAFLYRTGALEQTPAR